MPIVQVRAEGRTGGAGFINVSVVRHRIFADFVAQSQALGSRVCFDALQKSRSGG